MTLTLSWVKPSALAFDTEAQGPAISLKFSEKFSNCIFPLDNYSRCRCVSESRIDSSYAAFVFIIVLSVPS